MRYNLPTLKYVNRFSKHILRTVVAHTPQRSARFSGVKGFVSAVGVISFADSDQPSEDAQQEAIKLFEALALCGA